MDEELDETPGGIPPTMELQPSTSQPVGGSSRSIEPKPSSSRPNLTRMTSIRSLRRSLSSGVKKSQGAVAQFLGVDHLESDQRNERQALWDTRRMMLGKRFGARPRSPVKPSEEEVEIEPAFATDSFDGMQAARDDELKRKVIEAMKKPSVARLTWDRISKKVAKPETERTSPSVMSTPLGGRPPPVNRMVSFQVPLTEQKIEIPEEPSNVIIRKEKFFDQDEPSPPPPVPRIFGVVSAAQAKATAAAAPPLPLMERRSLGAPMPSQKEFFHEEPEVHPPPLVVPEVVAETGKTVPDGLEEIVKLPPPKKKRYFGMSFLTKLCMQPFQKDLDQQMQEQLMEVLDHRPYFTYWVTVVQILILVVSVAVYGFAPVGFDAKQHSSLILETSLALETVDYLEPENFWLGPRAAALIHLGAKYAPCMRPDEKIANSIAVARDLENRSACCIANDESGCVQSTRDKCSKTMATFYKWPNKYVPDRRSGSVCGLDPAFCLEPPSTGPHEWPDDITKWPICTKKAEVSRGTSTAPHMTCEVVGHPCCMGIQGECRITTREYCDFVQGYFHETALLCSQVSCLDKICGMLPFFDPEVPDQFYRLWTAIFLHAGFLHILFTIIFQYFVMRDTEKLTGCIRMAIIYIMSGMTGNLASAIFTPYVAEVGPSGSQFGVFACIIVEIIYSWKLGILEKPWIPLARMMVFAVFLFLLGLVPWTDNYSHIFGFIFGFLLSLALLPFGTTARDRRIKVWIIIGSLLAATGLFAALIVLFYIHPVYDCEWCEYLNCIPFTPTFCDNQKIKIQDKRLSEL